MWTVAFWLITLCRWCKNTDHTSHAQTRVKHQVLHPYKTICKNNSLFYYLCFKKEMRSQRFENWTAACTLRILYALNLFVNVMFNCYSRFKILLTPIMYPLCKLQYLDTLTYVIFTTWINCYRHFQTTAHEFMNCSPTQTSSFRSYPVSEEKPVKQHKGADDN
jgi:hypothetical protein